MQAMAIACMRECVLPSLAEPAQRTLLTRLAHLLTARPANHMGPTSSGASGPGISGSGSSGSGASAPAGSGYGFGSSSRSGSGVSTSGIGNGMGGGTGDGGMGGIGMGGGGGMGGMGGANGGGTGVMSVPAAVVTLDGESYVSLRMRVVHVACARGACRGSFPLCHAHLHAKLSPINICMLSHRQFLLNICLLMLVYTAHEVRSGQREAQWACHCTEDPLSHTRLLSC